MEDRIIIDRLLARGVIGLNEWERKVKQDILITAVLTTDVTTVGRTDAIGDGLNYGTVSRQIMAFVEASERHTIEALAFDVAGICASYAAVSKVWIKVSKPAAERFARAISVEIERTPEQLVATAYIALGSNSDPEENLRSAVSELRALGTPVGVSTVYQTAPRDGRDRPDFLNAVVALCTSLPAGELRRRLKEIERIHGRVSSPEAPISLDLDLCLLDDRFLVEGSHRVPHPDVLQHHYLAMLLAELDPALRHPETGELLSEIAARLPADPAPQPRPDLDLQAAFTG